MSSKIETIINSLRAEVSDEIADSILNDCREVIPKMTPANQTKWIKEFIACVDTTLDIDTRNKIMENCSANCISKAVIEKAVEIRKSAKDIDELLVRLNELHIGGGDLKREDRVIIGTYHQCYCGLVKNIKEKMSSTYCNCSKGWFKRLFEAVFGEPIKVELGDTIIQGAAKCTFKIYIPQ